MRSWHKKVLGLIVIAVGIYIAIDAVRTPGGLGPVFKEWTGISDHDTPTHQQNAQPSAPVSDVPTPSTPLNK